MLNDYNYLCRRRYVSERGAVDSLLSLQPGPGSPMFRMATEGDARYIEEERSEIVAL
jgi:hypothetical protein